MDLPQRRATALRELARQGARSSDGRRASPAWLEASRCFDSEQALLLAVHQRWQVNLLARLDLALEQGSDDPHLGVLRAVEELSRDLPGFAEVLHDHADDPALLRARRRLADLVGQACTCGRPHPVVPPRRARAVAPSAQRHGCALAARCRRRLAGLLAAVHPGPDRGVAPRVQGQFG